MLADLCLVCCLVLQGGIGPAGLASEDLHVLDFTDMERPRWHRCGVLQYMQQSKPLQQQQQQGRAPAVHQLCLVHAWHAACQPLHAV